MTDTIKLEELVKYLREYVLSDSDRAKREFALELLFKLSS